MKPNKFHMDIKQKLVDEVNDIALTEELRKKILLNRPNLKKRSTLLYRLNYTLNKTIELPILPLAIAGFLLILTLCLPLGAINNPLASINSASITSQYKYINIGTMTIIVDSSYKKGE